MLADSSRQEEGDYLFKYENEILLDHGKDLKSPISQVSMWGLLNFLEQFNRFSRAYGENDRHATT